MIAGAATGALWKCTGTSQTEYVSGQMTLANLSFAPSTLYIAGIQPMIITSGLLTVGAAGWTITKQQFL